MRAGRHRPRWSDRMHAAWTLIEKPADICVVIRGQQKTAGIMIASDLSQEVTMASDSVRLRRETGAENSMETAKKSTSPTVLVVDAEPLVCWSIAEVLGERGYEVTEAHDAASAMRAFAHPTDVVLLDVSSSDSDDLHVLSAMHRLSPNTLVILMTAYNSPDLLDEARRLGAFTVIDKPFEMNELAPIVDLALAGRSG